MTTRESLNGKPYAGNPHVRFDEGGNALVATSRHGSLLYKMRYILSLIVAAGSIAALATEPPKRIFNETDNQRAERMPWMLFASGSSSERVLAHRREVREAVAAGGLSAAERALKDKDPGVRRFALYSVYERNQERGVVAARRMLKDRNASVRALAQELLRDRTVRKTPTAGLPLSQNPVNDHELTHVKSIVGENGRFVLPPKIKSDVVEVWFGRPYRSVKAWVNDSFAGEWHMERDSGREFRVDATRLVKWDSANKVLVMDAQGSIISMKFSVEVIKCEQ